ISAIHHTEKCCEVLLNLDVGDQRILVSKPGSPESNSGELGAIALERVVFAIESNEVWIPMASADTSKQEKFRLHIKAIIPQYYDYGAYYYRRESFFLLKNSAITLDRVRLLLMYLTVELRS
ncbi:hypothetical protein CEXT_338851, partial [Caerostris extrusa]